MTKLRVRLPEIKLSEEVSRRIGMTGFKLKAASPELLVGIGIAGVIVSTALACKATLKAETVMNEAKETLNKIEECKETVDTEKYSEADYKKDIRLVYLQTCVKMAKIYAPAAVIGVMSITCILAGHDILKKRNIAMNAAYSAAAKSFSDYRERVREELGEEFVVTKGLDGCLFVFPNQAWQEFEEKLRALPLTNKSARQFSRFFVAGATPCELDKQGRILLPATLREFAGLDKEVVLTGMLNRIEIWSKDKWMENNSFDDMDDIAEQMTDLGLII